MYLHLVKLVNFKSIGDYNNNEIIVEPKITAIIGKNESGKSNILEGLSKINFTFRDKSAFLDDNVNRNVDRGAYNLFKIILKPTNFEIDKGVIEDTEIEITKTKYTAKGGILQIYKSIAQDSINKLKDFLINIGSNPFGLQNQEYTTYKDYLNELSQEDYIDIYKRNLFLKVCINKKLNIPQDKREDYNKILSNAEENWKIFTSFFPTFFYRNTNKILFSTYKYEDIQNELANNNYNPNSLLREFVKVIDIPNEDFLFAVKPGMTSQQITKRNQIQKLVQEKINKAFNNFYTTEKICLGIEFNAGNIVFTVNKENGNVLWLSERSNGLRWYLNLFIDMIANEVSKNVVFLLDEPGIGLHVNAQRELINLFNHLAENGNQIIYTTHSPYMLAIENEGIHRIRAVVKGQDEYSYIYKTAYDPKIAPESQYDTLTPIISALGMNLTDTFGPAKNKLNIVTEGMSDYIYICLMAKQLKVDLRDIVIIPSEGASNSVNICMILHGWGCKFLSIFDFDEEGVEAGGNKIKDIFNSCIGESYNYVVDVSESNIEKKEYKTNSKMIEDIVTREEIDKFCSTNGCSKLSKTLVAKLLSNAVENGSYKLGKKCINNFKNLFIRLGLLVKS